MLRYKADYKTLFTVALYFAVIILSWKYFSFKWYIFIPIMMVNCTLAFIITTIVHNTIHCPIFKKKWQNKVFQVILTIANGHPVSGFVSGHNLSHHKHLLTNKDNARPSIVRFKWNLLNQVFLSFFAVKKISKNERRFVKKMMKEKPAWARQYFIELAVVTIIKIILLIIDWQRGIFLILLPLMYSNWGILGTNFWQHDGCDGKHPYNHSRTFTEQLLIF